MGQELEPPVNKFNQMNYEDLDSFCKEWSAVPIFILSRWYILDEHEEEVLLIDEQIQVLKISKIFL